MQDTKVQQMVALWTKYLKRSSVLLCLIFYSFLPAQLFVTEHTSFQVVGETKVTVLEKIKTNPSKRNRKNFRISKTPSKRNESFENHASFSKRSQEKKRMVFDLRKSPVGNEFLNKSVVKCNAVTPESLFKLFTNPCSFYSAKFFLLSSSQVNDFHIPFLSQTLIRVYRARPPPLFV